MRVPGKPSQGSVDLVCRMATSVVAHAPASRGFESPAGVPDLFRIRTGRAGLEFSQDPVRIRFGDCLLDGETRELSRGGKPVHVEPKAYKLLEILLTSRPKALSKDELQDQLWPDTFVSERSLARLVDVLRDCLGDEARHTRT